MSLNPFDEGFDPSKTLSTPVESFLEALSNPRDRIIANRATPLNNIAACASVEYAPFRILKSASVRNEIREKGVKRSRENRVGVLGGIHEQAGKGPLVVLKKAVEKRFRVRVVLRERHTLAGFVDGFVVAFDKHFNLVIRNAWVVKDGRRRVGQLFVRGLALTESVVGMDIHFYVGWGNRETRLFWWTAASTFLFAILYRS